MASHSRPSPPSVHRSILCWCALAQSVAEFFDLPLPQAEDVLGPAQVITWEHGVLVPNISGEWHKLRGPIGTVCVTGDDRVGKSTLLTLWGRNLSNSTDFSFSVGDGKRSHTQGVWSAILPAAVTGLGYNLNLCDSQGLKQAKGELQQWRLFSANVLIPSVLVYMVTNVFQNDQLRDLARMAHQFMQLSSDELGRFRSTLSPHLIVVVREENEPEGDANDTDDYNLNAHLEEELSGEGYEVDKELVRQVFQTREAWSLARRVKRDPESVQLWRSSAEVVLQRLLAVLGTRHLLFPQGGPELVEWYQSVLQTVNSQERNSIGRLVGLSEHIVSAHWRRSILEKWRSRIHLALAVVAMFIGFGGFLGRSLDLVAWCVWVALCVCYVGTSPFVTTPLSGFVPQLCEQMVNGTSVLFAKTVCSEVSSQTAALVLALVLGLLSYPLLTAQFRYLLEFLPLPKGLRRSGATLLLSAAFAALGILGEIDMSEGVDADTWLSLGARAVLMLTMAISGMEFVMVTRSNRVRLNASTRGRMLHFYVAARVQEVRELEASQDWANHFRSTPAHNALWRYRSTSAWLHVPIFLQAGGLLVWAHIIRPHFDAALSVGVVINLLYWLWRMGKSFLQTHLRQFRDPVDLWWNSLEHAGDDAGFDGSTEAEKEIKEVPPESQEEQSTRHSIEQMRRAQEPERSSKWAWLKLLCWLSLLCACSVELLRRSGYINY